MNTLNAVGTVAVVAHDAGGAAFIDSYLSQANHNVLFVISGPAERIFRLRDINIQTISLSEALEACDWVLTGSGWQSDLEWQAIRRAKSLGKSVVTLLDHWVNYPARFVRDGVTCLPDQIWVVDNFSANLASECFQNTSIRQIDIPFFDNFVREVESFSPQLANKSCFKRILFVSENIDRSDFHQNDAFRYFMSNIEALNVDIGQIIFRPHPSETSEKYLWLIKEYGNVISFSQYFSLSQDVSACDIVVGCSSMAMALAVKANKRVISCIPNNIIPFTLPFDQIEHLSSLVI